MPYSRVCAAPRRAQSREVVPPPATTMRRARANARTAGVVQADTTAVTAFVTNAVTQYRKGDTVKSFGRLYVAQRDFISDGTKVPGSVTLGTIPGAEDWRALTNGRRTLLNQQIAPFLSEPPDVGTGTLQPLLFWPTQHAVRRNT